jgi:branched-chain amino acid transport system ATP-binding protein
VPTSAADPLLDIAGLHAGYAKIGVLHGVDLRVGRAEIVALLGPNGAGKTTLLRAVSGLLPTTAGTVTFSGRNIRDAGPRAAVRAGLAHVIEGHRIFTQLSARVDEALGLFPEIAAKRHDRGGALSGGQQQMLAVAQGLVRRPRLLMLDEPSAGLSPLLVDRVLSVAARLRETGASVLLVEQLIEKALAVANRVYALARGRIVLAAPTSDSDLPHRLERAYFGHDVPTTLHR